MSNEFGGLGEGLDIGGAPRQDVNKVSEEAVRRIQEQTRQAKQVHQQIQQDKDSNKKIAEFLSFLLDEFKEDSIVSLLYELFFKTKNPTNGTSYLRKKINSIVIVGFFFPFYNKEANSYGISPFFSGLLDTEELNLTGYITYIKKLSAKYHDNVPLDINLLLEFLAAIIARFNLYDVASLDGEQREAFLLQLKNELYK